ncbi:hypothetical protein AK812_SmicGene5595 [Symbiodinium microadriaticum]|uniref:Uncharacterized protein n=1 Tax=Symbiodinium microadriaticum TaxID=2951 RepID=A0A1Q9ETE6_SYMMI|nr:hypothetical protein AK812_SmicGene5595 [Symbiodinium microadriaticum]
MVFSLVIPRPLAMSFFVESFPVTGTPSDEDAQRRRTSMMKAFGDSTGGVLLVSPQDDNSTNLQAVPNNKNIVAEFSENLALFSGSTEREVDEQTS